MFLEPSQPRAHAVNHWNLWPITLTIFHLSDLKSVSGNSLRITFCRKSPLQGTPEKMWAGPCETLGKPWNTVEVLSAYPYLGAIAWHHRIWGGWGWGAGQTKADVTPVGTSWRRLKDLQVSGLSAVTCWPRQRAVLQEAHTPFLLLIATLLDPYSGTQASENQAVLLQSCPCR